MAFSFNKKNLANTTLNSALTSSATSIVVEDASVFPVTQFYATLMPSSEISGVGNSEVVLVTGISGNTLTVVRGQKNTTAKAFSIGAVITNGIYSEDMDMAQAVGKKVFSAVWDSDNSEYKINDPMLKVIPDDGTAITAVFDTTAVDDSVLSINEDTTGTAVKTGTSIEVNDASPMAPVSTELQGDTKQTTYSGKNLANPEPLGYANLGITATYNAQTGEITLSGTATGGYSIPFRRVDQTIPAGTYTIKQYGELSHGRMGINFRRADGTQIAEYIVNTGTLVNTFTLSEPAAKTYLFTLYHSAGQTVEGTVKFQMEAGSTATSFEPYVGGAASPNPDYPQEVQTVTGRQVVTITDGGSESQSYTVDLGSIELCKIGDYQDYIYKSGDDWYVHKETGKVVLNGTEHWTQTASGVPYTDSITNYSRTAFVPYSDNLYGVSSKGQATDLPQNSFAFGVSSTYNRMWVSYLDKWTTGSDIATWLTTNPTSVYYVLQNSSQTDTQITDADLIAQLEALNSATLFEGENTITCSSQNLPAYLELTYYKNGYGKYTANIIEGGHIKGDTSLSAALVEANTPYNLVFHDDNWWVMNMSSQIEEGNIYTGAVTTSKIANGAITNEKLNVTWPDVTALYYQANDVVSEADTGIVNTVLNGYITTGNTDVQVTIPLAKRLDNITTATITKMVVIGRCQGSYLTGLDGSGGDLATLSTNITVHISKETNSLSVLFNKSGGWGGTNNSTVSLAVREYSITLS